MEGAVVIYESKYGFTETYAKWIAEAAGADLFARKDMKPQWLERYGTIVYGGGLYASGVSGISFLAKHAPRLQGKRLAVFTCGVADPELEENRDRIQRNLFEKLTPGQREQIQVFHVRGGLDYAKMGPLHRMMMGMMRQMIEKKTEEQRTDEDRQILTTYGKKVDLTDRATVRPIVAWMQQDEKKENAGKNI